MLRLIGRVLRGLIAIVILGGALYVGGPYLLALAGSYLITRDAPVRADMAVVLSGQPFLRVPEAARLYHEGLVAKILLVNAPRPRGQDALLRVGIRYPDSLEVSRQLLEALRVPRESILTIQEPAESTQAEAEMVSHFLAGRSVRTLLIVTSKAHSTRAHKIFEASLGPKVALVMHPVSADPFDPNSWWKDRVDLREGLWEYAALADWWLRGLWRAAFGGARGALLPPVR